jgi:hypothetical protein
MHGRIEIVRLLCDRGADIEARNNVDGGHCIWQPIMVTSLS